MTIYTAIEPQHYRETPTGIGLECIDYIELLPYSQGTAGKYCYRAGNKDPLTQDLNKTLWYIKRADRNGFRDNLLHIDQDIMKTIDPMLTHRSNLFYLICYGELISARYKVESILEILKEQDFDMDLPLTSGLEGGILKV